MTKKWKVLAGAVAVFALSVGPVELWARGGGGGGGGRGGGFSGGSRGFSSPSRSTPAPSRSYSPSTKPSAPAPSRQFGTPSGRDPAPSRQFGTPKKDTAMPSRKEMPSSRSNRELSKGSERKGIDSAAGKAKVGEQSRRNYEATHQPSYNDLKRDLDRTKFENRELRQRQYFGTYYNRPAPVVVYHDNFNLFFWLWLMDRPAYDRDRWIYHHRDEMDQARYNELLQKDKNLENRLKALEAQGVTKDSSYVPSGVERDLMYSDDYVKQAYQDKSGSGFPWGWLAVGIIALTAVVCLVFFVRFRVNRRS